jgi:hypothetical protein
VSVPPAELSKIAAGLARAIYDAMRAAARAHRHVLPWEQSLLSERALLQSAVEKFIVPKLDLPDLPGHVPACHCGAPATCTVVVRELNGLIQLNEARCAACRTNPLP